MFFVGASVKGLGHKQYSEEVEDYSKVATINGYEIAVVSDGAGSSKYGKEAAITYTESFFHYFYALLESKEFNPSLYYNNPVLWKNYTEEYFPILLEKIQQGKGDLSEFGATLIVSISSNEGFLLFHIGDGRACYRNEKGQWINVFEPHKGEYVNQTFFVSDFPHKMQNLETCYVYTGGLKSFVIMSDGMENAAYQIKENIPFVDFFEPNYNALIQFQKSGFGIDEASEIWYNYLTEGNSSLKNEGDDKTMIFIVY